MAVFWSRLHGDANADQTRVSLSKRSCGCLRVSVTSVFSDLRALAHEGTLLYPYSTRELVHIVKHLQVCNGCLSPGVDSMEIVVKT